MDSEQLLRSFLDKLAKKLDYKDHRIELEQVSSSGANFTSQVFLPVLAAPGKANLKLFTKTAVFSKELRSVIRYDLFNTEILFFSELVQRYRNLEDTYNVPEEERLLIPKYYGGSKDYMSEFLVLENIVENGYQDFDRFTCYDWNYASKCIEQLAILHSLSIAFAEKYPEEFERLTSHLSNGFCAQDLKHFLDRCSAISVKVCHDDNKEKLRDFVKKNINNETFEKFCDPKRGPGLVHGDFRPNNIMHKVNKDNKLEVMIIDYQILQRGNPFCDLMYFIACGSDTNFRAKYLNKLLNHYYAVLSRALLRFEVVPEKVYSKQDFDNDVQLYLPYGLMLAVLLLPIITLDESKIPHSNDFIDGENFMKDANPELTKRLNEMVNDFIKLGVL